MEPNEDAERLLDVDTSLTSARKDAAGTTSVDISTRSSAGGARLSFEEFVTDGVETDLSSTTLRARTVLSAVEPLRFYDESGDLLVEFAPFPIYDALVSPLLEAAGVGSEAPRVGAAEYAEYLLFSSDGVDWQILVENDDPATGVILDVVVGDDELLYNSGGQRIRLPLPAAD